MAHLRKFLAAAGAGRRWSVDHKGHGIHILPVGVTPTYDEAISFTGKAGRNGTVRAVYHRFPGGAERTPVAVSALSGWLYLENR